MSTLPHSATYPAPVAPVRPARHLNNFNLCRLVFALLVIFSHVPEALYGNREHEFLTRIFHTISLGELAVDGFFLLSGYLIVQSWLSGPSVAGYLRKRILRIFPGFLVASLLCALLFGPLGAGAEYFTHFNITKFFAGVLVLGAPQIPAVFTGTNYAVINGAMWTIHFEFLCYLLVLGFGALGLLRHRSLWLAVTVLVTVLNVLHRLGYHPSLLGFQDPLAHPMIRLSMPFMAGACFFLYREQIRYRRSALLLVVPALLASLFFGLTAEIGIATLGAYCLFYFALTPSRVLMDFNKLPDISYGVYLYGWPVMKLLHWYQQDISVLALTAATVAGALACGVASWYIIEKPFMKMKGFTWRRRQDLA